MDSVVDRPVDSTGRGQHAEFRSQDIILWRRLVCGIEREIVAQREERVALLGEAGPGKVGEAKLGGVEAGWRQVALDVGVIIIGEIQADWKSTRLTSSH